MSKLKEKLNSLLEQEGRGAKTRLAKFLGVPRNYPSRWIGSDDYGVPRDQLPRIAEFFGVTVDYLLAEDGKEPLDRKIPVIGPASCGVPGEYYGDSMDYVYVPSGIYKKRLYAVTAEGDSMSPKINHGDIVICDPEQMPNNGDIVHYTVDGESGIKKIKFSEDGETIILLPINTNGYEPIIYNMNNVHSYRFAKCVRLISSL